METLYYSYGESGCFYAYYVKLQYVLNIHVQDQISFRDLSK